MTTLSPESALLPEEEDRTIHPDAGIEPSKSGVSPRTVTRLDRVFQTTMLALVIAAPASLCISVATITDPDIWWHLSAGQLMLQHHAILRVDPFSITGTGRPWEAYSWLYELLVVQLFQRFGLVGLAAYSAGMVFAITLALWHLIKRLQPNVAVVSALVIATCMSFGHLIQPRPWMFSILFFVFEVDILMQARRTGRARELAWLPIIFALWSNIHIQFIDGLMVLGLATAEAVVTGHGIGEKSRLRASWAFAALAGSVFATMINPFGWHIYQVAYNLAAQTGVMNKIQELQAIPFRDLIDFTVLALTIVAAAALGWQRRFQVFEIGLLAFGAVVSFRSQRDVWVIGIAAAAILAPSITARANAVAAPSRLSSRIAIAAAMVLVLVTARVSYRNNTRLQTQLEKELPVAAVDEIRAKGYAGPLYNDFTWGGYLIWALRMPVSVDGRAAFYGDAALNRSDATWMAMPHWASDPQLKAANLVLGPVRMPLSQALRIDPQWQLAYEDNLAIVFVRKPANPTK